ncbi:MULTISPECIES: tetratricopeptide repeat protein [unclassified Gilliamella]|uniref:tetratricopeptide repeat protein n=1 Tax=unclassified Gilliamella TaxID=2685620 RepID=UPI001C6A40F4|nr:tetratricopeptide repeat protein [Gilliamella sp. ESL0441]QYN44608.1 tetratricopeptide repeat protein [Gilliamella sp. ESL0441]
MPFLGIGLSTIIALFFAVHAIKTRQEQFWLSILLVFPFIGSLIYFFVIFLPDFRQSPVGYQIESKLLKALDPQRELREALSNYEISPTVEAKVCLAKALIDNDRANEALIYYQEVLTGIYESAPDILLQYAYALYQVKQYKKARETLDYLREKNPNYRSDEGHLLYTKILVALELKEEAQEEFNALISYYPSLEAASYYLQTLIEWHQISLAKEVLQKIELRIKHLPKHAKRINQTWIKEIEETKQKLNR